jgi:rsbT co-antagonist protein RsbR
MTPAAPDAKNTSEPGDLIAEIVAHLRSARQVLRVAWDRRVAETRMFALLDPEQITVESTELIDRYFEVLESGSVEAIQSYTRLLAGRIVPRSVDTQELLGLVLALRDASARSLAERFEKDPPRLRALLDVFEPAANRIATTVADEFVREHERLIQLQQTSIRELSTPVLQVRDRLLIHPIIGLVDADRARQITEQMLHGIRARRAKVVVMDLTGVPIVDAAVANQLVQAVEAARLLGASVIVTGLSPDLSRTLVSIGVDLSSLHAVGDLQGGIEAADAIIGYRPSREPGAPPAAVGP